MPYTDNYSKEFTRIQQKKKVANLPKIMKGMIKRMKDAKGESINNKTPASDHIDFSPLQEEEDVLFVNTEVDKETINAAFETINAAFEQQENQGLRKFNESKEDREVEEEEARTAASTPHGEFVESDEWMTGNECLQDIKVFEMSIMKTDKFGGDEADESDESEINKDEDVIRKLFYDDESVKRELQDNTLILYNTPQKQDTEPPQNPNTLPPQKHNTGPVQELLCKFAVTNATGNVSKQLGMNDLWDAAKDVIEALNPYEEEGANKNDQEAHAHGSALMKQALPKDNQPTNTVAQLICDATKNHLQVEEIEIPHEIRVLRSKVPLKTGGSAIISPVLSSCVVSNAETCLELKYKTPEKSLKQLQTTIILLSPSTVFEANTSLNDSDVFDSLVSPDNSQACAELNISLDSPDIAVHSHALEMRCFDVGSLDSLFPAFRPLGSPEIANFGEMAKIAIDRHQDFSPFAKKCENQEFKVINGQDSFIEADESQESEGFTNCGEMAKAARDNADFSPFTKRFANPQFKANIGQDSMVEANESHKIDTFNRTIGSNTSCCGSEEVEIAVANPFTSFEGGTKTPVKDNIAKEHIEIDANDSLEFNFPSPVWDQTISKVEIKTTGMSAVRKIDFHTKPPPKNIEALSFMLSDANTLLSSLQDLSLSKSAKAEGATKENVQEVFRSMRDECIDRLEYNVQNMALWRSPSSVRTVAKQETTPGIDKVMKQVCSAPGVTDFPLDEILNDAKANLDKAPFKAPIGDKQKVAAKKSAPGKHEEIQQELQDMALFSISQRIALFEKKNS